MRTLAVMHLPGVTGPAKTLLPRLATLAECGDLVTLVPSTGTVERMFRSVGRTAVRPYAAVTYPRDARALARFARTFVSDMRTFRCAIRNERPDVVVIATSVLPAALQAARLEDTPSLVYAAEIFDQTSPVSPARRLAARALLSFTGRSAHAIVCPSDAVARQYTGGSAIVTTVFPGIAVRDARARRLQARQRFFLPDDAFCVAVVGSITEGRGQAVAIRAMTLVLPEVPETYCLVAGAPHPRESDRAYETHLRQLVRSLRIEDRVFFPGHVDLVDDVYAAADVVVNPALVNEAFGRAALEAIAAGRPVVASSVGAIPSVLDHERTALLVPPGDVSALAEAILRLHAESDFAESLVRAGREMVQTRFTEEHGIRRFREIVASLVAEERTARLSRDYD